MIFEQYYLECLSHASYLVGDETSGRAVVVDPQRDIDGYLADAAAAGLTIERVIETHLHADFLSGHLELAARAGAVISFGDAATVDFPSDPLHDGQRLSLGDVTLEILSTPGHTPESICVVVYEQSGDETPYGVLTGDTLFVGDVGRPDLLASAGSGLTADVLGRKLFHSLHDRLLRLPDATRVFPAHGAGSSCGKQLSSETSSTIGDQRRYNYALAPMTEDEFVAVVTEGQPVRPHYFEFDASRNRQLRPLLDEHAAIPTLSLDEVLAQRDAGAVLLDTREPADFAAGHLVGAVDIGLQGRFAEWAGDVLDPARDIVLVGDPAAALESRVRLARIGFDRVLGQLDDPNDVLVNHPELVERSSRLTIEQLAEISGLEPDLQLVDIRNPGETSAGVLPGAVEMPLPTLVDTVGELDPARPTVAYCATGYRSAIAASVLREAGIADASDLVGGYLAWSAAGLPIVAPASADDEDPPTMTTEPPEITADDGAALVDAGALLLDVRETDEWVAGHAPAAMHVPMRQVPSRVDDLPRDRQIVAVCRSGGRSRAVTEALIGAGFDAVNVTGGMRAWEAAGLPIETDGGAPGVVA
jgi:rhodanese-related sulfurtransferase/glyoxylase-like metal-dependent hydrolase (beta-lactamase superfamily II)